jgi:hypothetical protein
MWSGQSVTGRALSLLGRWATPVQPPYLSIRLTTQRIVNPYEELHLRDHQPR